MLQAWMIRLIPGGAEGLEQLVRDGKTLRGSAVETEDGNQRHGLRPTASMMLGIPHPEGARPEPWRSFLRVQRRCRRSRPCCRWCRREQIFLTVLVTTRPLIFRFSQDPVWRPERFCMANDD